MILLETFLGATRLLAAFTTAAECRAARGLASAIADGHATLACVPLF